MSADDEWHKGKVKIKGKDLHREAKAKALSTYPAS